MTQRLSRDEPGVDPDIVVDPDGRRYELRAATCPTCGPAAKQTIGIRGGRYHRYGLGLESTIVRCRRCTLLFPDPFPHPLDVQEMYGDPEKYFALHDDFETKSQAHRELIREIKCRTGKADPAILDVGSGRGTTLRAAMLEGVHTAIGLELSRAMIEFAGEHGLSVLHKTAEQFAKEAEPGTFDAVVLSAVLEHVEDPSTLLAAVARVAAPGAIVMVEVPREPNLLTCLASWGNRIRGNRGVVNLSPTFPPYHVYGFNPTALSRLLLRHGFTLEQLVVRCSPRVPHDGTLRDRARALAGSVAIRVGNATGTAPNMMGWARRGDG